MKRRPTPTADRRLPGRPVAAGVLCLLMPGLAAASPPPPAAAPLTLDDCVRLAREHNPDLQAARHRIAAAGAEMAMAESAFRPLLSVGQSYQATDNPALAFTMQLNQRRLSLSQNFNDPDITDNNRTDVGLDWRLYDGGRRRQGKKAAAAGMEMSTAVADGIRNEMIYQVHRGFFAVLQANEFVRIQEATVRSLETSLTSARQRLQAGTVVKTDVLNLEVRLAESREQLARARNREALSRSALGNLLGLPELPAATLRGPDLEVEEDVEEDAARLGKGAAPETVRRPELWAAQAEVERHTAEVERTRGTLRPTVDLQADYYLDSERFDDMEDSWLAGVSLRWDIFDGARRRQDVQRAQAELAGARERARRVRLDLDYQMRAAELALDETRERVRVTARSVDSAQESLDMTRYRYVNGAADITELLAAETALTSARALAVSALYDREVARAGLRRAAGAFAADDPGPEAVTGTPDTAAGVATGDDVGASRRDVETRGDADASAAPGEARP